MNMTMQSFQINSLQCHTPLYEICSVFKRLNIFYNALEYHVDTMVHEYSNHSIPWYYHIFAHDCDIMVFFDITM